ncbi:MAG: hypothetical protein WEF86_08855 [Gemmatimonadota bacterium]
MIGVRAAWSCLVVSLSVVACGARDAEQPMDAVEPIPAEPLPTLEPASVLEVAVTIGEQPGPVDDFVHPAVFGRDAEGDIYVFDIISAELRKVERDGSSGRALSRRGDGPGEIPGSAMTIVVDSSRVFLYDERSGRLAAISTTGELVDDALLHGPRPRAGALAALVHVTEDGSLVLRARVMGRSTADEPTQPVNSFAFVRATPGAAKTDTLYSYERPAGSIALSGGSDRVLVPGPRTGPTVNYDRSTATLIRIDRPVPETAAGSEFTIQRISPRGEVLNRRVFSTQTRAIEPEWRDTLVERVRRQGRLGGGDRYGRMSFEDLREAAALPAYYPAVEEFHVGEDGTVWLKTHAQGEDWIEWVVLDSAFNPIERVRLPEDLRYPIIFDNEIWGTIMDDYSRSVVRLDRRAHQGAGEDRGAAVSH